MSPKAQQIAYVVVLLALVAALVLGVFAAPEADTRVRSAGVSGSSRAS
ncbi:hypothetical protein [Streptomyces sp. CC53]|nr:hypothetical protein [Streptomyces sp. CC53]